MYLDLDFVKVLQVPGTKIKSVSGKDIEFISSTEDVLDMSLTYVISNNGALGLHNMGGLTFDLLGRDAKRLGFVELKGDASIPPGSFNVENKMIRAGLAVNREGENDNSGVLRDFLKEFLFSNSALDYFELVGPVSSERNISYVHYTMNSTFRLYRSIQDEPIEAEFDVDGGCSLKGDFSDVVKHRNSDLLLSNVLGSIGNTVFNDYFYSIQVSILRLWLGKGSLDGLQSKLNLGFSNFGVRKIFVERTNASLFSGSTQSFANVAMPDLIFGATPESIVNDIEVAFSQVNYEMFSLEMKKAYNAGSLKWQLSSEHVDVYMCVNSKLVVYAANYSHEMRADNDINSDASVFEFYIGGGTSSTLELNSKMAISNPSTLSLEATAGLDFDLYYVKSHNSTTGTVEYDDSILLGNVLFPAINLGNGINSFSNVFLRLSKYNTSTYPGILLQAQQQQLSKYIDEILTASISGSPSLVFMKGPVSSVKGEHMYLKDALSSPIRILSKPEPTVVTKMAIGMYLPFVYVKGAITAVLIFIRTAFRYVT